jgi:DNA-binding MarR family transcriptional regulator
MQDYRQTLAASTNLAGMAIVFRRLKAGIAHSHGLTLSQYRILLLLRDQASEMRIVDVAEALEMKTNTVAAAIPALERGELLSRAEDQDDRRAVRLRITRKGKAALRAADAAVLAELQKAWAALTPEQVSTVRGQPVGEFDHLTAEYVSGVYRVYACVADVVAPRGITYTQLTILLALAESDSALRPVDLAAHLGLHTPTLAMALTSLEELGLVKRTRDASDRRASWVGLTDVGRSHVSSVLDLVEQALARQLGHYSADEIGALFEVNRVMMAGIAAS